MKTHELIGPALDWAVAKCEGGNIEIHSTQMIMERRLRSLSIDEAATLPPPTPYLVIPGKGNAQFSTDWAQGGPIIDRERIQFRSEQRTQYRAFIGQFGADGVGPTHLIAAMRCYVASKLGDEIEIPEELT